MIMVMAVTLVSCKSAIYEKRNGLMYEIFKPEVPQRITLDNVKRFFGESYETDKSGKQVVTGKDEKGEYVVIDQEEEEGAVEEPHKKDVQENKQEKNKPDFLAGVEAEDNGLFTKYYQVEHQTGATLIPLIRPYASKKGHITNLAHNNTIVITDTRDALTEIGEMLEKADNPKPQVLIEVLAIEIRGESNIEFGFELSSDLSQASRAFLRGGTVSMNPKNFLDSLLPGSAEFQGTQVNFATVGKDKGKFGAMSLWVRALRELGYAEILTKPKLMVTNNSKARIETVSEVPYQTAQIVGANINITTTYKKVGVKLDVTPQFIGKEEITLYIKPEVSTLVAWTDPSVTTGITNPVIATRSAETTVSVKDGDLLVIGGLREKKSVTAERRVPLLGDIPVLGWLFRSTRKEWLETELVFFLKTTIVKEET